MTVPCLSLAVVMQCTIMHISIGKYAIEYSGTVCILVDTCDDKHMECKAIAGGISGCVNMRRACSNSTKAEPSTWIISPILMLGI